MANEPVILNVYDMVSRKHYWLGGSGAGWEFMLGGQALYKEEPSTDPQRG